MDYYPECTVDNLCLLRLSSIDKLEHRDRLDMRRLREQVEATDAFQDILPSAHLFLALPEDHAHVPRLRMHVTADVHDRLAPELDKLVRSEEHTSELSHSGESRMPSSA